MGQDRGPAGGAIGDRSGAGDVRASGSAAAATGGTLILPGVINARGVGRLPWLYRAASLDGMPASGAQELAERGIGLVIDLRDGVERGTAGAGDAHGVRIARVPIYGDEVAGPPRTGSLDGLYRRILDEHGDRVAEAVGLIARSGTPVLVHCTAGKDRTGLIVAVALAATGFGDEEIIADYVLSEAEVRPARAALVADTLAALDLEDAEYDQAVQLHLASPAEAIAGALAHLRSEHGGAAAYLTARGLADDALDRLARLLGGRIDDRASAVR